MGSKEELDSSSEVRNDKKIKEKGYDLSSKKELINLLMEKEKEILELKQAEEARRNFLSLATHELKTPLVSICGASSFLNEYFSDKMDKTVADLIGLIDKGSLRLRKLIDNMLDFSRIEMGRFYVDKKPSDLVQIINETVSTINYLIFERNHKYSSDMPKSLVAAVDPGRFEQLISNLLSNAIKNTRPGGRISLILVDEGDKVRCEVFDNGVGITKEEKEKLFQKFGKITRHGPDMNINIQGSGLGLFLSKRIVEAHGGKIWVESEGRNKGCKFTFQIKKE
ncbi:MAG: sensor histidine kinase [Promethearchaeota archaeon]